MNEVLRARKLTEEILAKAAAIKGQMNDINQRMQVMEQPSKLVTEKKPEAVTLQLLDLSDDVLRIVLSSSTRHYESLNALSRVCKRLRNIVINDDRSWRLLCQADWGITESQPQHIPCLDTILLRGQTEEDQQGRQTGRGGSKLTRSTSSIPAWERIADQVGSRVKLASLVATSSSNGRSMYNPKTSTTSLGRSSTLTSSSSSRKSITASAEKGSPWRSLYRDRMQGWGMVRTVLSWLASHDFPRNVSGSMHRLQLNLALRYMELCSAQPQHEPRRQEVLKRSGLKAMLALLDNDSGGVQELALSVLANLLIGNADTKMQVLIGSRMGKLMCDKLDSSKSPGVVQQASRALINLWAEFPVPDIVPLLHDNRPARPQLESGRWLIQEYSLRGESFSLLHVQLTFNLKSGSVRGGGYDLLGDTWEEFIVKGRQDAHTGEWNLTRTYVNVGSTVLYTGYSDLHGAWGVYRTQRIQEAAAAMFSASSGGRQPKVFRLFQNETLQPDCPWTETYIEREDLEEEVVEETVGLAGRPAAASAPSRGLHTIQVPSNRTLTSPSSGGSWSHHSQARTSSHSASSPSGSSPLPSPTHLPAASNNTYILPTLPADQLLAPSSPTNNTAPPLPSSVMTSSGANSSSTSASPATGSSSLVTATALEPVSPSVSHPNRVLQQPSPSSGTLPAVTAGGTSQPLSPGTKSLEIPEVQFSTGVVVPSSARLSGVEAPGDETHPDSDPMMMLQLFESQPAPASRQRLSAVQELLASLKRRVDDSPPAGLQRASSSTSGITALPDITRSASRTSLTSLKVSAEETLSAVQAKTSLEGLESAGRHAPPAASQQSKTVPQAVATLPDLKRPSGQSSPSEWPSSRDQADLKVLHPLSLGPSSSRSLVDNSTINSMLSPGTGVVVGLEGLPFPPSSPSPFPPASSPPSPNNRPQLLPRSASTALTTQSDLVMKIPSHQHNPLYRSPSQVGTSILPLSPQPPASPPSTQQSKLKRSPSSSTLLIASPISSITPSTLPLSPSVHQQCTSVMVVHTDTTNTTTIVLPASPPQAPHKSVHQAHVPVTGMCHEPSSDPSLPAEGMNWVAPGIVSSQIAGTAGQHDMKNASATCPAPRQLAPLTTQHDLGASDILRTPEATSAQGANSSVNEAINGNLPSGSSYSKFYFKLQ